MKDVVEEVETEEAEIVDDVVEGEEPTTDESEEAEVVETEGEGDETEAVEENTDEPEGLSISFGEEDEGEKAEETPVIRTLRQQAREEKKRRKELERKLEELSAPKAEELGPRPTLADCDYDDVKFEKAIIDHNERKHRIEAERNKEKEQQEASQKEWNDRLMKYQADAKSLGVDDYEEAEDVIKTTFNPTQQGVLIAASLKPELVVYALGKSQAKMDELAKITDPVRFAAEVARLETKMKVTGTKSKPAPEKRLKAATMPKASGEKKLEQLREQAAKTGDYSQVIAYKKQLAK